MCFEIRFFVYKFLSSHQFCSSRREQQAYICNYKLHWFTIRKLGKQWFNLNSNLQRPVLISDTYLSLFLEQLRSDRLLSFFLYFLLLNNSNKLMYSKHMLYSYVFIQVITCSSWRALCRSARLTTTWWSTWWSPPPKTWAPGIAASGRTSRLSRAECRPARRAARTRRPAPARTPSFRALSPRVSDSPKRTTTRYNECSINHVEMPVILVLSARSFSLLVLLAIIIIHF